MAGQANFGSIIGTVSDPAGAVIASTTVKITSSERGTVTTTTTNESGNYIQTHLDIGTYQVEFKAAGFAPQAVQDVEVRIDGATKIDAQLTVGQAAQAISVTSAAPPLVTDRGEVSVTLGTKQVEDLPVLNRNLTALQLLLPGAAKVPWQHATSENPQGGIQINNNGQRFGSTNFMIDGMDNNDPVLGIIVINPDVDSVGEMKQTTGNFDAESAQAGGAVIQVETKSGGNAFHGSVFEFFQNHILNSRDPLTQPMARPLFDGTTSAALWVARSRRTHCFSSATSRVSGAGREPLS